MYNQHSCGLNMSASGWVGGMVGRWKAAAQAVRTHVLNCLQRKTQVTIIPFLPDETFQNEPTNKYGNEDAKQTKRQANILPPKINFGQLSQSPWVLGTTFLASVLFFMTRRVLLTENFSLLCANNK